MNKKDIEAKLKEMGIENYIIYDDGTVDVNSSVDISFMNLKKIPFQFKRVIGDFNCSNNKLYSLKGSPESVGISFFCHKNQLSSLKGAPKSVGKSFICNNNILTSLEGAPHSINGNFICSENKLISLNGAPITVKGNFDCSNNRLTSLSGISKYTINALFCSGNPIPGNLMMDYNKKCPFLIFSDEDE